MQDNLPIRSKHFGRFGVVFEVRIKDIYHDIDKAHFLCITWEVILEGVTSPTQMATVQFDFETEHHKPLSNLTKTRLAKELLNGVNIRQEGDLLIVNIFEDSPDPWQNHPGTHVRWHTKDKTFNPHAWSKAA